MTGGNMRVRFDVGDTQAVLGNNGIVLYIADNDGNHVGKLRIGKAVVEWCGGRIRIGNGKKKRLDLFISEILKEM
jgi:hypothetical protein